MQIETKEIILDKEIGNTETRYFTKTDDGFDGTAQGYGFKSRQKLEKAYWFFKNKDKINEKKNQAKKFLKAHPEIKKLLDEYFSAQNYLYAAKDGEEINMNTFLKALEQDDENNHSETIKLLNDNKILWRNLLDW